MFFDLKPNFLKHFENMPCKFNKTIGLLQKLHDTLSRPLYCQFISDSLDHTLIIAILSIIKRIMRLFNQK